MCSCIQDCAVHVFLKNAGRPDAGTKQMSSSTFSTMNSDQSLVGPVVAWLQRNAADPQKLVDDAERQLCGRGRSLPRERRIQYAEKVLIGEFLSRWAKKHHGRSPKELGSDPEVFADEIRPFEFAMMAAGDEGAFKRLAPRFARKKMVEHVGLSLGTGEDFTAYVADNTLRLADLFLKNFDPSRPSAARKAVRYIQMTAVSWYLVQRTRPVRTDAPNLEAYLAQSKRINSRTALAIKLAYLPALLTPEERAALRDRYGFKGSLGPRIPIKDIARVLGYATAAALSRKLYRVRRWCRRSSPAGTGGVE